jgi:predicted phosphohydrolase
MQRFVWTSDIHLDRMSNDERAELKDYLSDLKPDGFILAGDIAEADSVAGFLKDFREALSCPIYFVLGNHDFWGSTFEAVRSEIRSLVKNHNELYWLSESGVISLNSTTALIGHEGWADARYAPVPAHGTVPRDFMRIEDFKALPRAEFEGALNKLGGEAAAYIRKVLSEAVAFHKHVYLVTHVPPFKEASLDRSRRICGDDQLPFYSCKAIGDVLLEVMKENPECRLTVLSGHTHEKCEVEILPNLQIRVLDAGYGTWYPPRLIKI